MAKNANMHAAKKNQNDEFYTQLADIESEVMRYKDQFKGKVVFCNCDDPAQSNFWKFFELNFDNFGLKKLMSTHFDENQQSYKLEIIGDLDGDGKVTAKDIVRTPLKQNGDFRSDECVELLKEADIVCTNPPFSCYSDDTEVLTKNGWKYFKDVKETDVLLSMDPFTKTVEYSNIVRLFKHLVSEKLYHFTKRGLDLMVTSNHRMICNERKSKFCRADEIKPEYYSVPIKDFDYIDGNFVENFILPEIIQKEQYSRKEVTIPEKTISMNSWLEFFGFWLADGCTRQGLNSQGNPRYCVSIKQNKSNEDYVINLYKNIGFDCKIESQNNGNNNYVVYSKQLWTYLNRFGKSADKFIPREFLDLEKSQLFFLLKGYLNGDSNGTDQVRIGSVSEQLCADLQELILKVDGKLLQFIPKKSNGNEYLQASYSTKNLSRFNIKYPKPELVDYQGFVYCAELEKNHTMLVRRNGIISWCGNCFREYIEQLIKYRKKFLIVGNPNAITYKEVFKLIKDKKLWLGIKSLGTDMLFGFPDSKKQELLKKKEGSGWKTVNGKIFARASACWFTNLEIKKKPNIPILIKKYNPKDYPQYDNYSAINVNKVKDIPYDYQGVMGVPITILGLQYSDGYIHLLDEFSNEMKYEIVGAMSTTGITEFNFGYPYINGKKIYARVLIKKI